MQTVPLNTLYSYTVTKRRERVSKDVERSRGMKRFGASLEAEMAGDAVEKALAMKALRT